jgi:hypothetical protein
MDPHDDGTDLRIIGPVYVGLNLCLANGLVDVVFFMRGSSDPPMALPGNAETNVTANNMIWRMESLQ